jgi:hypothetical protein
MARPEDGVLCGGRCHAVDVACELVRDQFPFGLAAARSTASVTSLHPPGNSAAVATGHRTLGATGRAATAPLRPWKQQLPSKRPRRLRSSQPRLISSAAPAWDGQRGRRVLLPEAAAARPRSLNAAESDEHQRWFMAAACLGLRQRVGGSARRVTAPLSKEGAMLSSQRLLDATGRRRSPATSPGFRAAIAPGNRSDLPRRTADGR